VQLGPGTRLCACEVVSKVGDGVIGEVDEQPPGRLSFIVHRKGGATAAFRTSSARASRPGPAASACPTTRPVSPSTWTAATTSKTIPSDQPVIGCREHSWHIGDPGIMRDLIDTMNGVERWAARGSN